MKKLLIAVFVLSFVVLPTVSHAGLFDFLRSGQGAQVKTAVTSNTGAYYKKGDRADVILQIQKALNARGLYAGDLSGLIGSKTEASIKAWQKSSGLAVTGLLDVQTINSILGRGSDNGRGGGNGFGTVNTACAPNDAPWIKVKNPNGGETYLPGENVKVQWESCNIDSNSNVGVSIWDVNTNHYFYANNTFTTVNDGIEQVTLPQIGDAIQSVSPPYAEPFQAGTSFKVRVVKMPMDMDPIEDYSDNVFSIGNQIVGGGNCDSDNVELDILPLTTQMSQIDDLPVLEFRVDNQTNCQVALEDMTFIYMVTDTLPYFEEMSVIDKDTNMVVAEGMIDGSISGESLWVAFNGTNGYMIDAQDEQTFVLYVQSYQQPAQGALGYDDYLNKNLIFGLSETDQVDFKFWENGVEIPQSESWNLGSNRWGSVVRLPASAL